MIVGLMAVWAGMGTFSFGDVPATRPAVSRPGIFSQVRPRELELRQLAGVPDGMVQFAARTEMAKLPPAALERCTATGPGVDAANASVAHFQRR